VLKCLNHLNLFPNYSTLSFPIKKSSPESVRTKFIFAESDPIIYRASPKEGVMKRFVNYFSGVPNSEVVVIPGDHGFNNSNNPSGPNRKRVQQFNINNTDRLINEIRDYIEKVK